MQDAMIEYEDGLVVGTAGKYETRNPISRWLISGFDRTVADLAARARPRTIYEIGCGEGHTAEILLAATEARILATDISRKMVARAAAAPWARAAGDRIAFQAMDLMDWASVAEPPDLVVCLEVLEHLKDPRAGLDRLMALRAPLYLVSVPREPVWRAMNCARGAYLPEWGNSPGHLNHWSKRGFLRFLAPVLRPVAVRSPLPWTVALCVPAWAPAASRTR